MSSLFQLTESAYSPLRCVVKSLNIRRFIKWCASNLHSNLQVSTSVMVGLGGFVEWAYSARRGNRKPLPYRFRVLCIQYRLSLMEVLGGGAFLSSRSLPACLTSFLGLTFGLCRFFERRCRSVGYRLFCFVASFYRISYSYSHICTLLNIPLRTLFALQSLLAILEGYSNG
ncbi:hypothetical protein ARMSODRAFT_733430 [Armillaria solidipes]|uniref:Uncharacterized protein n=1 Tax=Armillaria solidipes TaxID=1076256 RepID=A0A2H3AZK5_9AGAR|nr:hypothetical protein ARMSODRAFT_733430 [Armillaria solidipes]